jgi:hypothetical protein
MTAAAHDRYFVVDGGEQVVAVWPRVNGWAPETANGSGLN